MEIVASEGEEAPWINVAVKRASGARCWVGIVEVEEPWFLFFEKAVFESNKYGLDRLIGYID